MPPARDKALCALGTSNAPITVASAAEPRSHWKSDSSVEPDTGRLVSIRLARNGAWNEFDVRETRISKLNSVSAVATCPVLIPAILAAYASVPMRWMTNVSPQMTARLVSMDWQFYCSGDGGSGGGLDDRSRREKINERVNRTPPTGQRNNPCSRPNQRCANPSRKRLRLLNPGSRKHAKCLIYPEDGTEQANDWRD